MPFLLWAKVVESGHSFTKKSINLYKNYLNSYLDNLSKQYKLQNNSMTEKRHLILILIKIIYEEIK